jgi:hypothetical protein
MDFLFKVNPFDKPFDKQGKHLFSRDWLKLCEADKAG